MRFLFILLACSFVAAGFSSCTPQDEYGRTTSEAGGTVPWNRPEKWEGGGMLGSQMQQGQ